MVSFLLVWLLALSEMTSVSASAGVVLAVSASISAPSWPPVAKAIWNAASLPVAIFAGVILPSLMAIAEMASRKVHSEVSTPGSCPAEDV
jgi:hypothetical protein